MKKKYLSKEWLVKQHIDVDLINQKIYHTTPRRGKVELSQGNVVSKKKYGETKSYKIVGWYNGKEHKQHTALVHRIMYVWAHPLEELDNDDDIDHVLNDPDNNDYHNLVRCSHVENMRRRPGNGHNDSLYYGMYGMPNEEVDKLQVKIRQTNFVKDLCTNENKELRKLEDSIKEDIINLRAAYEKAKIKHPEQLKEIKERYKSNLNNLRYAIQQCKDSRQLNYRDSREAVQQLKAYKRGLKDKYNG